MQDFKKLDVWKKSHQLALNVYKETQVFPHVERRGLASQMRRASVSISSNIAEGSGRSTDSEMARYLDYSIGSASELHAQILLAKDLGFIQTENSEFLETEIESIKKMLCGLIRCVRSNKETSTRLDSLTTDNRQLTTDNRQLTTDN